MTMKIKTNVKAGSLHNACCKGTHLPSVTIEMF